MECTCQLGLIQCLEGFVRLYKGSGLRGLRCSTSTWHDPTTEFGRGNSTDATC